MENNKPGNESSINGRLNIDLFNAGVSLPKEKREEYKHRAFEEGKQSSIVLFMLGEATGRINQYFENKDAYFKEIKKLDSFVFWNTKKKEMQRNANLRDMCEDLNTLGLCDLILNDSKNYFKDIFGDGSSTYAEYALNDLLRRIDNGCNGYSQITAQINKAKENMTIIGKELAKGYEGVDVSDEKAFPNFYANRPLRGSIDKLKSFADDLEISADVFDIGEEFGMLVISSEPRHPFASMLLDKYVFGPVKKFREAHSAEIEAYINMIAFNKINLQEPNSW